MDGRAHAKRAGPFLFALLDDTLCLLPLFPIDMRAVPSASHNDRPGSQCNATQHVVVQTVRAHVVHKDQLHTRNESRSGPWPQGQTRSAWGVACP